MKKINIKKWLPISLFSLFVLGFIGAVLFPTFGKARERSRGGWQPGMDTAITLPDKLPDRPLGRLDGSYELNRTAAKSRQMAELPMMYAQVQESEQNTNTDLLKNKKIIRNAELDIQTKNVVETYNAIVKFATENGGYEFNKNLYVRDDYNRISAVIKISPKNLDAFLLFISQHSEVINCNVSSQDITEEYLDAATRLKSLRNSLQAYYAVMEKAKTINEIITVKSKIDEVTMQIESLEGKLKYWDNHVSESTVTLTVSAKNDPMRVKKEINWTALSIKDMGQLIKNGFLGAINVLITAAQWIIIAAITVLPIAIILWILFVIIKKQRAKREPYVPRTDFSDEK